MGEIAGALIMDLSALGHTLKPLIRDGYVETVADKDDHRIRLTKAGEKKLAEATKAPAGRPAAPRRPHRR
jgi:DNA-binding MarR family transcriptional regulator